MLFTEKELRERAAKLALADKIRAVRDNRNHDYLCVDITTPGGTSVVCFAGGSDMAAINAVTSALLELEAKLRKEALADPREDAETPPLTTKDLIKF